MLRALEHNRAVLEEVIASLAVHVTLGPIDLGSEM
jgi:hypothetical protein